MRSLVYLTAALLVGCLESDIPALVDPAAADAGVVEQGPRPDAGEADQAVGGAMDQGVADGAALDQAQPDSAPGADSGGADLGGPDASGDGGQRACEPGVVEACGDDVGACQPGVRTCGVDGRFGDCAGGVLPEAEICNGLDDDCDGAVDEGLPADVACVVGQGVCQVEGAQVCTDGELRCDAVPPQPAPRDACDGALDDDCDGLVDEGCACVDDQVAPCGLAVGACVPGTQRCAAGAWGACEGAQGPQAEACDGQDNDCDGTVDEGEAAAACSLAGAVMACVDGECAFQRCERGRYDLDERMDNGCERGLAVQAPTALGVATDGPWVDAGPLRVLTAWVDDQDQVVAQLNQDRWIIDAPSPAHPVARVLGGQPYVGFLADDGGGALVRVVRPPDDLRYEHPAVGKPALAQVDGGLVVAHFTPDARLLVQRVGGALALSAPGETFDPQVRPAVLQVDEQVLVVAQRTDGDPRLVLYTWEAEGLQASNRTLTGPWTGVHLARYAGRAQVALSAVQNGQTRRLVGPVAGVLGGGFVEGGGSSFGQRPYMTPSSFAGPGQLLWVAEYVRASNPAILLLQANDAGGPVDGVPFPNEAFELADELRFVSGGADFAYAAFRIGNQASLVRLELE